MGNGYRSYCPALFRFSAPDTWSPFVAGPNPYIYCSADPINRVDPSGHISILALESDSIAAAHAMLTRDPWVSSETNFTTLWRSDSRSPQEIRASGFAGTNSSNHALTLHEENRTVFSSRTPQGALKFIKAQKEAKVQLDYFLYKIKAKGLRAASFQRNYDRFGEDFIYDLAGRDQKRVEKFLPPGEESSPISFHYQIVGYQVDTAYLPVDEVHVQGPISPERILHVHADDPDVHNAYVLHATDTDRSPRRRRANSI